MAGPLPLSAAALPAATRSVVTPVATPAAAGPMTLMVGVVVVALYVGREILVPITLAVLLSFLLAPLTSLLRRARLGRVLSVLLAMLFALGIIITVSGVMAIQLADLAGALPQYASTIERKVDDAREMTVGRLSHALDGLGKRMDGLVNPPAAAPLPARPGNARPVQSGTPAQPVAVEVHAPPPSPFDLASRILSPVVSPVATLGIVFIVATFILLQKEDLRDRLIRLLGSGDLHRATTALDDAARRLSRYFLTQLALNTAFGAIICLGLLLIGIPNPILWGCLAGILRFVPYIGSLIGGVIPVALAAAVDPGWSLAIWTAALFLVSEPLMGQVVEPLVYGHSTGLSPVSVVVAAIFWTWIWGPIGLILAMPLTLCLVALGRHVDRLAFIDVLLGDQPALTPVESLYQRMLAGDADEALEYAEQLLRERPLSVYYDEIALRSLRIAASDADRGVLTEKQLTRIRTAMSELMDELGVHDDRDPEPEPADNAAVAPRVDRILPRLAAPRSLGPQQREALPSGWRSETPVLCVAGRGKLDDPVASMLAQLLGKHGLGAKVISNEDASRSRLAALDLDGTAMVCICCVTIETVPSHLRFLIRRLRHRLPGKPVLVGIWPQEDVTAREKLGADVVASSLREAVNCCLAMATERKEALLF